MKLNPFSGTPEIGTGDFCFYIYIFARNCLLDDFVLDSYIFDDFV
jgi:hypothetical protein